MNDWQAELAMARNEGGQAVKQYFNVCDVVGGEVESVDVITFGSPCQDLSIAGKRAGLKHAENGDEETTRSGLFMEAVRIIKEMRNATNNAKPRFAVWENVPGAFSSGKGEDFRIVLEELAKIKDPTISIPKPPKGKWLTAGEIVGNGFSIAWRVLDAQYWGVPQRRRRIYLVADFTGGSAGEILFESEGLSGYFTPSGKERKRTAQDAKRGVGEAVCYPLNTQVITRHKRMGRGTGFGMGENGEPSFTLQAGHEHAVAYSFDSLASNSMKSSNPHSGCREVDVAKCLDTTDPNPSKNQGGVAIVQSMCFEPGAITRDMGNRAWNEVSPTLRADAGDNQPAVCCLNDQGGSVMSVSENISATLRSQEHGHQPCVVQPQTLKIRSGCEGGGKGALWSDKAFALATNHDMSVIAFAQNQREEVRDLGDKAGALAAEAGGHQQTYIAQPVIALQANGIDRADTAGCNGKGWTEDVCYTLNTVDRHAVLPLIAGTLAASGAGTNRPAGQGNELDFCVCETDRPAVYAQDAYDKLTETEQAATLRAKGGNYGGGTENLCATNMTVRRLTPTECARLQGFPDEWGKIPAITEMSDEDYDFWTECRKVKAMIDGKRFQPKTKEQTIKWYNKLHTDSAEYKAYGNGLALPCAAFVLRGIAKEGAKTLGSLFDGIGGFPLAGIMYGITPLWSSEIEPFAVAVGKERFKARC